MYSRPEVLGKNQEETFGLGGKKTRRVVCKNCGQSKDPRSRRNHYEAGFCTKRCQVRFVIRTQFGELASPQKAAVSTPPTERIDDQREESLVGTWVNE